MLLAQIGGVTEVINAADAAGAVNLLALVIALGIIAIMAISWNLLPILRSMADNKKLLNEIKADVLQGNQYNNANARAVADVSDTLSVAFPGLVTGLERITQTQDRLNLSIETQAKHFERTVDVMSHIYDRISTQSTQMDVLIGTTSTTRDTVKATQEKITGIEDSLKELQLISSLLQDIKQHSAKPIDFDPVVKRFDLVKDEILAAINRLSPTPTVIKVPEGTMMVDLEVEKG